MASPRQVKHRGPAQKRVLDGDVIVLREIDPRKLGRPLHEKVAATHLGGGQLEGDQPWFLDNYVAADQPRDAQMAAAIMKATTGFAIARTDTGDILTTFDRHEVKRADSVANAAKVELAVDVALRESASDDADDDESA